MNYLNILDAILQELYKIVKYLKHIDESLSTISGTLYRIESQGNRTICIHQNGEISPTVVPPDYCTCGSTAAGCAIHGK